MKKPQTVRLLLQEHAKVSKCIRDFHTLPWSVLVSSPVLPSSLFLLSVDMSWQPKSFVFNCVSLTPLKMKLTLKLLAGQIVPEALQGVAFRLQYSFKLVYLNLNMGFTRANIHEKYISQVQGQGTLHPV